MKIIVKKIKHRMLLNCLECTPESTRKLHINGDKKPCFRVKHIFSPKT